MKRLHLFSGIVAPFLTVFFLLIGATPLQASPQNEPETQPQETPLALDKDDFTQSLDEVLSLQHEPLETAEASKKKKRSKRKSKKKKRKKKRSKRKSKKKKRKKKRSKRKSKKKKRKKKRSKKKSKGKRPYRGVQKETKGLRFKAKPGFSAPYDYDNLGRSFDGGGCRHQGIDVGGVGRYSGIGTPVRALVKAKVTGIATPEDNPGKYGKRDRRPSNEHRHGATMPRRIKVGGYGRVYPFTRTKGSSETGVMITTIAIGTEINGYKVRYMHLAAVHPDLRVGDILRPGQEIGLMGATGFTGSLPHVHIDIEDLCDYRVDPAPFLGLTKVRPSTCRPINKRARKYGKKAGKRKGCRTRSERKKTRSQHLRKPAVTPKIVTASHGSGGEVSLDEGGGKVRGKGCVGTVGRHREIYRVKKGDTLGSIAERFKSTAKTLQKENRLRSPNKLKVGQKIKVWDEGCKDLSAKPRVIKATSSSRLINKGKGKGKRKKIRYIVQKGDTLGSIAEKYHVKVSALKKRNKIKNPKALKVGQKIKIVIYQ